MTLDSELASAKALDSKEALVSGEEFALGAGLDSEEELASGVGLDSGEELASGVGLDSGEDLASGVGLDSGEELASGVGLDSGKVDSSDELDSDEIDSADALALARALAFGMSPGRTEGTARSPRFFPFLPFLRIIPCASQYPCDRGAKAKAPARSNQA
ncbi:MAG TPA: hypothetical protein VFQ35_02800 [Polyangiaceae bacterium]|nr:hypothetical protein [Polyangiaceae bacterium]